MEDESTYTDHKTTYTDCESIYTARISAHTEHPPSIFVNIFGFTRRNCFLTSRFRQNLSNCPSNNLSCHLYMPKIIKTLQTFSNKKATEAAFILQI
jgi:hypothetical protein